MTYFFRPTCLSSPLRPSTTSWTTLPPLVPHTITSSKVSTHPSRTTTPLCVRLIEPSFPPQHTDSHAYHFSWKSSSYPCPPQVPLAFVCHTSDRTISSALANHFMSSPSAFFHLLHPISCHHTFPWSPPLICYFSISTLLKHSPYNTYITISLPPLSSPSTAASMSIAHDRPHNKHVLPVRGQFPPFDFPGMYKCALHMTLITTFYQIIQFIPSIQYTKVDDTCLLLYLWIYLTTTLCLPWYTYKVSHVPKYSNIHLHASELHQPWPTSPLLYTSSTPPKKNLNI